MTAAETSVDLEAVERFVRTIPDLRQLLALPAVSERELALRAEIRRAMATLSMALAEAARAERRKTRAAVYRAAAVVAADLAAVPAALCAAAGGGDH